MSRLKIVLILLFLPTLAAANLRAGWGIGYRRDRISSSNTQSDVQIYKERSWLNGIPFAASLEFNPWKFQIGLEGDLGPFVSGHTHDIATLSATGHPLDSGSFEQGAQGFFADGQATWGYRLDLKTGNCTFQFTPLVAYSLYYNQLKRKGSHPSAALVNGGASLAVDLSHTRLKSFWRGPSLGGDLTCAPFRFWELSGGYSYYFLHVSQKSAPFSHQVYPGSSEWFVWTKDRVPSASGRGQIFRAHLCGLMANNCWLKAHFHLLDFSAQGTGYVSEKKQQVFPAPAIFSQKENVHARTAWRSLEVLLEVEYFF